MREYCEECGIPCEYQDGVPLCTNCYDEIDFVDLLTPERNIQFRNAGHNMYCPDLTTVMVMA